MEKNEPPPLYKSVAASTASIVLGKVCTHPLDTIKAKAQVSKLKLQGPFTVGRRVLLEEGVRGLYRGYGVALTSAIPAGALYMTWYEILRARWRTDFASKFACDLAAGFAAEAISCLFWLPGDVIKERLQVQHDLAGKVGYSYRDGVDALRQIYAKEGPAALYRAYGATLLSFGPNTAISLATYEQLEARMWDKADGPLPFWRSFLCASVSSCVAGTLTNPLDVAKVRMQVVRAGGTTEFPYSNVLHGIYCMARYEGLWSLTRGTGTRLCLFVPQTAIFLGTYKTLISHIHDGLET